MKIVVLTLIRNLIEIRVFNRKLQSVMPENDKQIYETRTTNRQLDLWNSYVVTIHNNDSFK